ncbi:hypothetical protein ACWKT5_07330 [Streptomyces avermitilis]
MGTPQAAELAAVLTAAAASVEPEGSAGAEKLAVTGLPADRIGALAFENGIRLVYTLWPLITVALTVLPVRRRDV